MSNALPIGELVCWEFPEGAVFQQSDLVRELKTAGLDPKYARPLCTRYAFQRAVRQLGKDKVVKNLKKQGTTLTFQLNNTVRGANDIQYPLDCQVSLDTMTDTVSCADYATEQRVIALIVRCIETRSIDDVARFLCKIIEETVSLVISIRKGSRVYFVPDGFKPFLDALQAFVQSIQGKFERYDQFGTPQTSAAIAVNTSDAIEDELAQYEKDIDALRNDPSERKIRNAWKSVSRAQDLIHIHSQRLGAHKCILEDHAALVSKLLSDLAYNASQPAIGAGSVAVP